MLQFCEECEIYHNISYVNGQKALNQCERKINEHIPIIQNEFPHEVIYINQQDFTPKSKTSFSSLSIHLPTQSRHSHFKPPAHVPLINVSPSPPVVQRINRLTVDQAVNNPAIRISFVSPPRVIANRQQLKNANSLPSTPPIRNTKSPFFKNESEKRLLSTIKQQGNDESQKSKSRKQSSIYEEQPTVQQNRVTMKQPVYVFKNIRKKYDLKDQEMKILQPGDAEQQNKQNGCWCW